MNEAEAPLVLSLLGLEPREAATQGKSHAGTGPLLVAAETLLEEFPDLALVIVTRGSRGSLLVKRDEWHEHPGFPVEAADTVGAGDALTAAIVHYLLLGAGLATLNEAGNRWGAWMASQSGAMPELPDPVHATISAAIDRVR
jgi:fructokinase